MLQMLQNMMSSTLHRVLSLRMLRRYIGYDGSSRRHRPVQIYWLLEFQERHKGMKIWKKRGENIIQ